jgi:hypothetical protein
MPKHRSKSQTSWTGVKAKLADLDRAGLLDLIHDLYDVRKDNQWFLHTRFGLGRDALEPYKKTIDRWIWPDVLRNQNTSVSKAKQAISDYQKALNDAGGLAELMVFYCEQAVGFCSDVGHDDVAYFDALVRMFARALELATTLQVPVRDGIFIRLDRVRRIAHNFGYGVGDEMDFLLSRCTASG